MGPGDPVTWGDRGPVAVSLPRCDPSQPLAPEGLAGHRTAYRPPGGTLGTRVAGASGEAWLMLAAAAGVVVAPVWCPPLPILGGRALVPCLC